MKSFACRPGCAACCIAPSITTAIPGHPHGKAASIPCANLMPDLRCALWENPERPLFCCGLQPAHDMCGDTREEAMAFLGELEQRTAPGRRG
jgi:hypothetical protein